jgi:hypothetical protein
MNAELINCTPHDISVISCSGDELRLYAKSGKEIRVTSEEQTLLPFDALGVPVVSRQVFTSLTMPDGIPAGSSLLVSMPVGEYFAAHPDECQHWIFGPDTGPHSVVCDQRGQICGTKRLVLYCGPPGRFPLSFDAKEVSRLREVALSAKCPAQEKSNKPK